MIFELEIGYLYGSLASHKRADRIFNEQATQALEVIHVDREILTDFHISSSQFSNLPSKLINSDFSRISPAEIKASSKTIL